MYPQALPKILLLFFVVWIIVAAQLGVVKWATINLQTLSALTGSAMQLVRDANVCNNNDRPMQLVRDVNVCNNSGRAMQLVRDANVCNNNDRSMQLVRDANVCNNNDRSKQLVRDANVCNNNDRSKQLVRDANVCNNNGRTMQLVRGANVCNNNEMSMQLVRDANVCNNSGRTMQLVRDANVCNNNDRSKQLVRDANVCNNGSRPMQSFLPFTFQPSYHFPSLCPMRFALCPMLFALCPDSPFNPSIKILTGTQVPQKTNIMAHMMQCKKTPMEELNFSKIETFEFTRKVALPKILIDDIIKPSWDKCAKDGDGVQAFIQQNIGVFGWDGQIEDLSRLILTNGTLPTPEAYDVVRADDCKNEIDLMWDNYGMDEDNERMDDELCFAVFAPHIMFYHDGDGNGFYRRNENAKIFLPYDTDETLVVFAFFVNKDHSDYSLAWCEEL